MASALKITKATIEHFKNIDYRVVEIDGKTLIISGKNQKGKSSLIQALTCPFNSKMIPPKPVKDGENQGNLEIVISGIVDGEEVSYTVGMHFNSETNKGRLYLSDQDGKTITSGQKGILDMIIGDISFDIMEFISLGITDNGKPSSAGIQKQIEFLEKLIPIDVLRKINALKSEKTKVYDDRTEINRDIKHLDGKIKSSEFTQEDIDKYSTKQSVQEVMDELEKAQKLNQSISKSEEFNKDYPNKINYFNNEIEVLIEKIEAIKTEKTALDEQKAKVDKWMEGKSKIDTSAIQTKLENLSEFNAKVEKVNDLKETEVKKKALEKDSQAKTDRLSAIDNEKDLLFKEANLPVEGLDFNDEGITFNGLPLHENQLPSSKMIEIGMKIGMALNPKLRLLVIKDGSLLDEDALNYVISEAEKNGYQLLIEIVSNSEEVSLEFVEHDEIPS